MKLTKEFEITEEEAKGDCTQIAKKGNKVSQVLNVILKQAIRDLRFKEIGRNSMFFDMKSKVEVGNSGNSLEIFKGIKFNSHSFANKLFLMVDYASRIMRT